MTDNLSCASSYYGSEYEPSIYSRDTTASKNRYEKEEMNERKKLKAGVYTIKRRMDGCMKKINLFNTAESLNALIINAVTGIPYYNDGGEIKYRIGSAQENDVFKVKFLTGENKIPGILLCYDSPEQYERHTVCTLDDRLKRRWHENNAQYRNQILRRSMNQ
jgi:hypothetical protein